MPPKIKITKEEIVQSALELIREGGEASLNARNIAKALDCSTQPIFSNFPTMEDLQEAVRGAAYERYLNRLKYEASLGKYPRYKSFGMAYIGFAKDEKELFKLLFLCDRDGKPTSHPEDFEESVKMIMSANQIERGMAERIHLESWIFVHGIATMIATSFLNLEWTLIEDMLTDIYQGVRLKHLSDLKEKEPSQ